MSKQQERNSWRHDQLECTQTDDGLLDRSVAAVHIKAQLTRSIFTQVSKLFVTLKEVRLFKCHYLLVIREALAEGLQQQTLLFDCFLEIFE